MRRLLRFILLKPVLWAAAKFSSRPNRSKIFAALDKLYHGLPEHPGQKGLVIPFELASGKFIIFSDQHKGSGNGADDFKQAADTYVTALNYYYERGFFFINLGDAEELWENSLGKVKKQNAATFEIEKQFHTAGRQIKLFGNHDLYWDNDPLAWWQLKSLFGEKMKVYEAVLLTTTIGDKALHIFCTHGHQGDAQSDGNWFSKFFVARIWAPLQAYLRINPNTPAYDSEKKSLHNSIMYDWASAQKNMLLITGHTHQPVFASLTHLERLYKQYQFAGQEKDEAKLTEIKMEILKREREFASVAVDYMTMRPGYFNSGCCCFSDGDITGLEIAGGRIRLIKWAKKNNIATRELLEEMELSQLFALLAN
jgi:hypothetical protein